MVAALGDKSVGVEADVSKVEDLQRLIDTAVQTYGRLDVMVNNAGIDTRSSVLDTTEDQFDKVMAINLKSAFFGTQLAAKQMIAQGECSRACSPLGGAEAFETPIGDHDPAQNARGDPTRPNSYEELQR